MSIEALPASAYLLYPGGLVNGAQTSSEATLTAIRRQLDKPQVRLRAQQRPAALTGFSTAAICERASSPYPLLPQPFRSGSSEARVLHHSDD
ncbi:hypothetical protein BMJ25_17405 [Sinorhizobium medicae]|nr:hypothetical protein BMJ25_17405 [Sinorhizobium medicae]